jgi:hypothetical protein
MFYRMNHEILQSIALPAQFSLLPSSSASGSGMSEAI